VSHDKIARMSTDAVSRSRRLTAVAREGETVTPLELFFDLVFVLALTQCTALMAADPTWSGIAKGMLVLGVLWWCWVGYAWLTSVVDAGGPYFFGADGWKLAPHHFAERHGLIIIIALGESIVAVGVGAQEKVDLGIAVAATVGTAVAAALWWLYFDIVALVAERRLASAQAGREQNEMARDSYSYLHFPMVAGIVLVALGMKKTLGHVSEPLKVEAATALLGGAALYLWAHVAFRYRHVHSVNTRRLGLGVLLCAFVPIAVEVTALATISVLAGLLVVLILVETRSYGAGRARLRHELR
jgi:low temperature requirement protein LtrA